MGTKIQGIASSEHLDSSGEILTIAPSDISDLVEGRAIFNWEHSPDPDCILGHITYAKKILQLSDCELDIQRKYWEKLNHKPYIYIQGELLDDQDNIGAIAIASMIRYSVLKKQPVLIGMSVEGSTLERDENILKRSVIRKISITLKPCNKTAIIDPILKDDEIIKKFESNFDYNYSGFEIDITDSLLDNNDSCLVENIIQTLNLFKTLTASGAGCAPSSLTGGAALSVEDSGLKRKLKQIVFNWDRVRPLKEQIKAELPNLSDSYIDYFLKLQDELSLKKGELRPIRIGAQHSTNPMVNESQKLLIEGLYLPNDHQDNYRLKNDSGDDVLVEHFSDGKHKRSASYHYLANDIFQMPDNTLPTNYFQHPNIPEKFFQATANPPLKTSFESDHFDKFVIKSKENGELHKLAIMDYILGAHRNYHNLMFNNGHLTLIDNEHAFNYDKPYESILNKFIGQDFIHDNAKQWLNQINGRKLIKELKLLGFGDDIARGAALRLKMAQHLINKNQQLNLVFSKV